MPEPLFATWEGKRLVLRFANLEALRGFFVEAEENHGFLVTLQKVPPLLSRIPVRAAFEAFSFDFEGEVVQSFPGADGKRQAAFQLVAWDERRRDLEEKLSGASGRDESERDGTSPVHRIKNLSTPGKIRLAIKADRTERKILLGETAPQVLEALLHNPRLEEEDVLRIIKSPYAHGGLLQHLAKDRRWGTAYAVRLAVAQNPKTPSPVALGLLESLRTPDLRLLARSSGVRENLRRTALKIYERRK